MGFGAVRRRFRSFGTGSAEPREQEVPMAKFCKNCGSELAEGAAFCEKCGAPVSGGKNK